MGRYLILESIFLEDGTVATPEEDGSFDTYEMRYAVNWTVSSNPTHRRDPGTSSQHTTAGGKWKCAWGLSVAPMSRKKLSLKHRDTLPKKALPGSGGALSTTKTVEVCCYDPINSIYLLSRKLSTFL